MDLTNTPEPELGPVGASVGTRDELTASAAGRHPSTQQLVRYFAYAHLADPLRPIAMIYCSAARDLVSSLPDGPELTVALRKLVESKDCAIRAGVDAMLA